jgi:hypothetical protein
MADLFPTISPRHSGIPLLVGLELSAVERSDYESIPPGFWSQAEYFFISGQANSIGHLRALMRHTIMQDVPDVLVKYHFSANSDRLSRERKNFLASLSAARSAELLAAADDPNWSVFQRMSLNLGVLLDEKILHALLDDEGRPRDFSETDTNDIMALARTFKTLASSDPTYTDRSRKRKLRDLSSAGVIPSFPSPDDRISDIADREESAHDRKLREIMEYKAATEFEADADNVLDRQTAEFLAENELSGEGD